MILRALNRVLGAGHESSRVLPAQERRQLQLAVAVLVHEVRRADYNEHDNQETDVGVLALADLFDLERAEATERRRPARLLRRSLRA